jgi:hypothetical protein
MLGLERPPRWGLVAIVVLVVANIGLAVLLVQRGSSPAASAAEPAASGTTSADRTTAPVASTGSAPPEVPSAPGLLAVYGDGYSSGNSEGGTGAAGWPALVADQLGMRLQLTAATLAGYARPGSTGQTYPQLVLAQPPTGATVTIVFGSRNDVAASPTDVGAAATRTFQAVLAAAPATELLVIGPSWSSSGAPAELTAVSAAVQQAARAAGATYVDPLTAGWFADPTGLVSPVDGISLLNAGHTYLAGLITPLVRAGIAAQ